MLAERRDLAAKPGAGPAAQAEDGRSLTEVAGLLESAGNTDEALAAYREVEGLLAGAASGLAGGSRRAGRLPFADGGLPDLDWQE